MTRELRDLPNKDVHVQLMEVITDDKVGGVVRGGGSKVATSSGTSGESGKDDL